jgi:hypothetical protein
VGHSRPMHLVPVPINVRRYSNSDIIVRRSEVTRRAIRRHSVSEMPISPLVLRLITAALLELCEDLF